LGFGGCITGGGVWREISGDECAGRRPQINCVPSSLRIAVERCRVR
jgi:hypothetical protein